MISFEIIELKQENISMIIANKINTILIITQ